MGTGRKALFVGKVRRLALHMRRRVLHAVLDETRVEASTRPLSALSMEVVKSSGVGLGRLIRGKRFDRRLCCVLRDLMLRVPSLGRHPRSLEGYFSGRLGVCGRGCGHPLDMARKTCGGLRRLG